MKVTLNMTGDEIANTQEALEAHLRWLMSDEGKQTCGEDASEIVESTRLALEKFTDAAGSAMWMARR